MTTSKGPRGDSALLVAMTRAQAIEVMAAASFYAAGMRNARRRKRVMAGVTAIGEKLRRQYALWEAREGKPGR